MNTHPADLLDLAISRTGSPICVGLDPVLDQLPEACRSARADVDAIEFFSRGVLDAVAPFAPAVKVQSACFERFGSRGFASMERTIAHARSLGMVVVLDAKRGDIGISASHYAASAAAMGAHFVTVSGYLGPSGVAPFLDAGLGAFVLVRTSNPDSDRVQSLRLADGRSVAEMMADLVAELGAARPGSSGLSAVGAVVGATKSTDGLALRARMPNQIFLIPGYGAQGGKAEDIARLRRPDGRGVLVTASRSVIYPQPIQGESWGVAVAQAARKLAAEIQTIVEQ